MYSLGGRFEMAYQWQERPNLIFGLPSEGFSVESSLTYAYFLSEHWMLGAALGTSVYSSSDITASNSFIQPDIRYYLNPSSTRINFFAGISPSLNLTMPEDSRLNLNLGANQFISEEIALEGSLNYSLSNDNNLLYLGLFVRPFFSKASQESKGVGSLFQRGSLILQQNVAGASLMRKNLSLSISPDIGFFLNDRTVLGARLSAATSLRMGSGTNFSNYSLLIRPYLRQYLRTSGKWNWFGEGGLTYSTSNSSIEENFDFQGNGWIFDASLGASIFIREATAIEPFIRGQYYLGGSTSVYNIFSSPSFQEANFENGPFNLTFGARVNLFLKR